MDFNLRDYRAWLKSVGLHPGTFKEFRAVLAREQSKLTLWGKLALAVTLIRAALRIGGVRRQQWYDRMKTCLDCPIYDKSLRRCRPFDGSSHGCGCYVPFLALVKKPYKAGCWAKEHQPDSGLGWE